MSTRIPKYRLHKGSGQALVQINRRRIYLGKFGSAESQGKYRSHIAEWLASGQGRSRHAAVPAGKQASVSLDELILAFWTFAEQRYVKNGEPTSEIKSFRTALRPLHGLYGSQPVTNFGPLALVACRQQLIVQGLCRKRINQYVTRIRQMFKGGVAREIVPETVWRALCAVQGLKKGEARETKRVKRVPEENIPVVQAYVTPQVWAVINFQLWTGCRPSEACLIRGIDLKMEGDIWEYRPQYPQTDIDNVQLRRPVLVSPPTRPQTANQPHARRRPAEAACPRSGR